MFLPEFKPFKFQITLIFLSVITLTYCSYSFAWEESEKRLINNNCMGYQDKKVSSEYLRCFRFDLTNSYSGHITKFSQNSSSILGCATDNKSRWCRIHFVSASNSSPFSIWIENDDISLNGVDIYASQLGDSCYCQIKEWAIETDRSIFYSKGSWLGKEANPLIESIIKAKSLNIYASIPNKFKVKYNISLSIVELTDFRKKLREAIDYIENTK
jgi:hypothetical protein